MLPYRSSLTVLPSGYYSRHQVVVHASSNIAMSSSLKPFDISVSIKNAFSAYSSISSSDPYPPIPSSTIPPASLSYNSFTTPSSSYTPASDGGVPGSSFSAGQIMGIIAGVFVAFLLICILFARASGKARGNHLVHTEMRRVQPAIAGPELERAEPEDSPPPPPPYSPHKPD